VRSLHVALVLLSVAGPLAGQRLPTAYHRWEPTLGASPPPAPALSGPARDYRWEGAGVGAVMLGLIGAMMGDGMCEGDHCFAPTVAFGLVGALVGGVTGGLVGSLIPKAPPAPQ